jgi:hypothetical protein
MPAGKRARRIRFLHQTLQRALDATAHHTTEAESGTYALLAYPH